MGKRKAKTILSSFCTPLTILTFWCIDKTFFLWIRMEMCVLLNAFFFPKLDHAQYAFLFSAFLKSWHLLNIYYVPLLGLHTSFESVFLNRFSLKELTRLTERLGISGVFIPLLICLMIVKIVKQSWKWKCFHVIYRYLTMFLITPWYSII